MKGHLVSVLHRSRHLDWTSPVVVKVAQIIGELLETLRLEFCLIMEDVEVNR